MLIASPKVKTTCQASTLGKEASMWRLASVLVPILTLACIAIASTIAWSNFAGSAGAPAYVTKADFDQAFADATAGRRENNAAIYETVGGTVRSSDGATTSVNRDRKSDRLPVLGGTDAAAPPPTSSTTIVRKNAASPGLANRANGTTGRQNTIEIDHPRPRHCEPLASPFADPVLGRVIGRCLV
jgi:hypothetical protein